MDTPGPGLKRIENNRSLTQRAVESVREAIHNGTLQPGELYSVYKIAEDLGVSRSPVREAMLRLEETGLVRFERNKGFRVVFPGPQELAEMIAVRIALEVPAARRAAARYSAGAEGDVRLQQEWRAMRAAAEVNDEPLFIYHDQRLHGIILELAGSAYVHRIVENLRDATRLVGASTIRGSRNLQRVYAEHTPIVEAILAGNVEDAGEAMDFHLRETGRILLQDAIERDGSMFDLATLWARLID
ncbi:GntR family transcriptional regulator [Arthrobacter sp. CAL618]|uniref:GntR family transcriptional regulator n=1 Tax=Arthrobacter sp. CAL618 TaxID=1055770 RepID=UPI000464B31E|nr:GntR family transcriptional regulator [Arthrobacter sp. CAL618]